MIFKHTVLSVLGPILLFLSFSLAQNNDQQHYDQRYNDQQHNDVISRIQNFSLNIFQQIAKTENNNVVLSPFSIWSVMSALAEGANGAAEKEFLQLFNLPPISQRDTMWNELKKLNSDLSFNEGSILLKKLNMVLLNRNIEFDAKFQEKVKRIYSAEIEMMDLRNPSAADNINKIVSKATDHKITEIIKQGSLTDAQMLLINTIFFKGKWTYPFNISYTSTHPFYDEDLREIGSVDLMYRKGLFPLLRSKDLNSVIIELPYGEERQMSFIVILPERNTRLVNVLEKLTYDRVNQAFNILDKLHASFFSDDSDDEDFEAQVFLPRFSIISDLKLNDVLKKMGLVKAFNSEADFSRLTSHDLFLSEVLHKAKIDVNEEGTEAVAVTVGTLKNRISPPEVKVVKPFIYLIVAKPSNTVLFAGTYKHP